MPSGCEQELEEALRGESVLDALRACAALGELFPLSGSQHLLHQLWYLESECSRSVRFQAKGSSKTLFTKHIWAYSVPGTRLCPKEADPFLGLKEQI